MEELSIEQKAIRYDEVIKKVNDYYEGKTKIYSDVDKTLDYLFPELKESGEQGSLTTNQECLKGIKRVQKYQDLSDWEKKFDNIASMYAHNKNQEGYNNSCYVKERAAAMLYHAKKELEKQATPQTRTSNEWVNMIDDACDKRYSEEYAHGEYCHEQSFKWGFQEGAEWLEKQDEQSSVIRWYDASLIPQERGELLVEWNGNGTIWHEIAFYHADTKTFWNGERQVENVTRWCYIVDLLEKQGKKVEPIEGFSSEFERQISQLIASIINKEYEYTEAFVKWTSDAFLNYAKREIEKQGEQKVISIDFKAKDWYVSKVDNKIHNITYDTTDKVEPKFKVGDWIVKNDDSPIHIDYICCKITKVENGNYTIESIYGHKDYNTFNTFEKDYHLWTIQDAKDGDVLATDSWLYMFKYINNKNLIQFHCNCPINGKQYKWCFLPNDSYLDIYINADIHPATKEQRDTLMKAMAEAGWEFDFEKKELKKVEYASETMNEKGAIDNGFTEMLLKEQKPVEWSEEDEEISTAIIKRIKGESDALSVSLSSAIGWIGKVKDRVIPQPKQEWSEEDEDVINRLLAFCAIANRYIQFAGHLQEDITKYQTWFKSLKERFAWKPSEK